MRWVTCTRPKVAGIACAWLITRFVDDSPEFLFVPVGAVSDVSRTSGAPPFDVPGAELSRHGNRSCFDALIEKFDLRSPALARLARVVRSDNAGWLDLRSDGVGLFSIPLAQSIEGLDDNEILRRGLVVYDALLGWISIAARSRAQDY